MVSEDIATRIATFRFGVIADFVNGTKFERGEKMRLIKEKAARSWNIPFSDRTHISVSTILSWIDSYKQAGSFEGLKPKSRKDKGGYRKLDATLRMAIRDLKRENPSFTVPVIIRKLRHAKIIGADDQLNKASIYRFIKKENLSAPSNAAKDRRKFEASYPNEIWQCDVLHGPKVKTENGQKKSYLFAILDDHSRLITHASFVLDEKLESLKECLRQAILKRGIPQRFYVDNGACYRATNLEQILAQLGVALTHSKPYEPEGRGKVERWFRYVRQDFLPMHAHRPMTIEELNNRLDEWVDTYNDKPHSATGETPYNRYKSDLACVRPAPDHLEDYFRLIEFRRVKKDRSIQINNRLFEVAVSLIDKKVEARFHRDSPEEVEIFFENCSYGKATLLDPSVNSRVGREGNKTSDKTQKIEENNVSGKTEISSGMLFGAERGQL